MEQKRIKPLLCKDKHLLRFEDHSPIGGPKDYWVCVRCGEEQIMFGK